MDSITFGSHGQYRLPKKNTEKNINQIKLEGAACTVRKCAVNENAARWYMTCKSLHVIFGGWFHIWLMIADIWQWTCHICQVTVHMWQITIDKWQLACDIICQVTVGMCQMTADIWQSTLVFLVFYQINLSSNIFNVNNV